MYGKLLIRLFMLIHVQIYGQVLISEIMFDPAGSDYTREFVEIYNAGSQSVIMDGWTLSDGQGTDMIVSSDNSAILAPGAFAVILDGDYTSGEPVYQSLIPDSALILSIQGTTLGSNGLSNSKAETVTLANSEGRVVDSVQYTVGNVSGYSDERIWLVPDSAIFADSRNLNGTPGFPNSVSPRQQDLTVLWRSQNQPTLKPGEMVNLNVCVLNVGVHTFPETDILFYETDLNLSQRVSRQFYTEHVPELATGDSMSFQIQYWPSASGFFQVEAFLNDPKDQNGLNDRDSLGIRVRYPSHALVINELMIQPESSGEWIELFNPGEVPVPLKEFSLSDASNKSAQIWNEECVINPGEYVVLFQKETDLCGLEKEVCVPDLPSLNNQSDTITLLDPTGYAIDKVSYQMTSSTSNISLERRNPDWGSSDADSWAPCASPTGSTPGAQNSVFFESRYEDVTLKIEPDPFSPDGDGLEDVAVVHYRLSDMQSRINLFIFDVAGRLVCHLRNGQFAPVQGQVLWDGCDDNGNPMNTGIYIVYLEDLEERTGRIRTQKETLVLVRNQ